MGKMKMGSAGASKTIVSPEQPKTITIEEVVEQVIKIPKPITKEVIVEIPKPVYKIVEVDEVVQKPKIKVEEVQQTVIKPIFSIKQETIILDQMQKKLEESVAIATNKLQTLNVQSIEQTVGNNELRAEVKHLKTELHVVKICAVVSVVVGIVAAIASILG